MPIRHFPVATWDSTDPLVLFAPTNIAWGIFVLQIPKLSQNMYFLSKREPRLHHERARLYVAILRAALSHNLRDLLGPQRMFYKAQICTRVGALVDSLERLTAANRASLRRTNCGTWSASRSRSAAPRGS